MPMTIAGQVGNTPGAASAGPTTNPVLRLGNMVDLIVSELHGRYYERAYRKTSFGGANQAAQAVTAAFATTYTGICLYNPNGSGYNANLLKVGVGNTVVWPAASVLGVMVGQSTTAMTGITALTPRSKNVGSSAAPVCGLASAVTLPVAPTLDTVLASIGTVATTAYETTPGLFDLEGGILLPPGAFACVYSTVALTAAGVFSMAWEEVPV